MDSTKKRNIAIAAGIGVIAIIAVILLLIFLPGRGGNEEPTGDTEPTTTTTEFEVPNITMYPADADDSAFITAPSLS